jgi:cobalamin-dependent methionine synthase I
VCTVGASISERVDAYSQEKDLFRGMMLSDLASYAVDLVRQELCEQIEDEAKAKGLHVSTPLSPGESEWPVSEQATIFSLLDAAQIGVTLTPSMVMRPLKSLSLIMGVGSRPMGSEGGSNCDFCTIRDRCSHRRLRTEMPPQATP